jgi:hypothetical protein
MAAVSRETPSDELTGAERLQKLSAEERARYTKAYRSMLHLARDQAVPIIFAHPLSVGGEVGGATGCVVQLVSGTFVVTASHVLEEYERRRDQGEALHWRVGKLPPFDPRPRIASRNKERDIVFLRISADEAQQLGPCIRSTPTYWPPSAPQEGQMLLVAGFPLALRDVDPSGRIGPGSYCAMFRVTSSRDGYCMCQIMEEDLISFDGVPSPPPGTKLGGISGGPVLLVTDLHYPLAGVIIEQCPMGFMDFLRIATLDGITLD